MANTNYNAFIAIIISEENQVLGLNPDYTLTEVSDKDFTHKITITEDGTLWALSVEPDTDGGGSKIYYSQIPNEWNAIHASNAAGKGISGGKGSDCFYIDDDDDSICSIKTDGTISKLFSERSVHEIGAGGGKLWAVYGHDNDGDIARLHFSNWDPPLSFTQFSTRFSDVTPRGLSVSSRGDCHGVIYERPWFYRHDNSNAGSIAEGVDNITLHVSWKETIFILTTDANQQGNLIMQMGAPGSQVYDFGSIDKRGIMVIGTFYKK